MCFSSSVVLSVRACLSNKIVCLFQNDTKGGLAAVSLLKKVSFCSKSVSLLTLNRFPSGIVCVRL